ncbi:hypothetical protein [Zymobacter sp. IVIA_12111.31 C1]|uniref:hypothetical protein n=1 Tax=Zymobacter sp. IVIA_12111.31 C1 TaxID=3394854 RepID=UPI0039C2D251
MNYKEYLELANTKIEIEKRLLDLLYTSNSTEKRELTRIYNIESRILNCRTITDLSEKLLRRLFHRYNDALKHSHFELNDEKERCVNIGLLFDRKEIRLLPFFVYKYVSKKNQYHMITEKNLIKIIDELQKELHFKCRSLPFEINMSDSWEENEETGELIPKR